MDLPGTLDLIRKEWFSDHWIKNKRIGGEGSWHNHVPTHTQANCAYK